MKVQQEVAPRTSDYGSANQRAAGRIPDGLGRGLIARQHDRARSTASAAAAILGSR